MTNRDDVFDWLEANADRFELHGMFSRGTDGIDTDSVLLNLMRGVDSLDLVLRTQGAIHLTWSQMGGGRRIGEEQLELGAGIPVGWVQFIPPTIIGAPAKWRPNLLLPGLVIKHPGADQSVHERAKSMLQDLVTAWMQRAASGPATGAVLQAPGSPLATLPGRKE